MSEFKLVSPLLDGFVMGDAISHHDGVRCCPAMERGTNGKYIVKIISIPASRVQLDALLLTGAYKTVADANLYFKDLADQVIQEAEVLKKLSSLEGKVVYIIDDVFTTGTTSNEIARKLKRLKPKAIYVLTFAKNLYVEHKKASQMTK